MEVVKNEWISKLDNCKLRTNRKKATKAINWLYELSEFKKPLIIFLSSPLGAQYGANMMKNKGDQVRGQVWDQIGDQVWATSYWAVKITLGLPIKHWFFDFLKLGVMILFVSGKVKVFGKKGKFLGEYDEEEFKK